MHTFVIVLHVTVAILMILSVLLQAGKGAGMGAAFGGSSSSVFGARGPATLISKITCWTAVIFMCTSLGLSLFQGGFGEKSVLEALPQVASPAPAADAAAPAADASAPAAPAADAAAPAADAAAPAADAAAPAADAAAAVTTGTQN